MVWAETDPSERRAGRARGRRRPRHAGHRQRAQEQETGDDDDDAFHVRVTPFCGRFPVDGCVVSREWCLGYCWSAPSRVRVMSRTPGDGKVKENSPSAPVKLPVPPVIAWTMRDRVPKKKPWTVIWPPGSCRSTVARLSESFELTEVSVPAKIPTWVVPAALSRIPRKISSSPKPPLSKNLRCFSWATRWMVCPGVA